MHVCVYEKWEIAGKKRKWVYFKFQVIIYSLGSFPKFICCMWKENPESNLCKAILHYLTSELIIPCFLCRTQNRKKLLLTKTSYRFIVLSSHKVAQYCTHELRIMDTDSFLRLLVKSALILPLSFSVRNSFFRKSNSIQEKLWKSSLKTM